MKFLVFAIALAVTVLTTAAQDPSTAPAPHCPNVQPACPQTCPSACPQLQPAVQVTCNCQFPTGGNPVTVRTTMTPTTSAMTEPPTASTTTTTSGPVVPRNDVATPCDLGVNVAIVLDASVNVTDADFARAKEFTKALAAGFRAPNNVTVIVYANYSSVPISLNPMYAPVDMDAAIDGISLPPSSSRYATRTDLGIQSAALMFDQNEVEGPRKMMVVTAGDSYYRPYTHYEAGRAKYQGKIDSICIGVGPKVTDSEFLSIVPDNYARLDSYDSLQQVVKEMSEELCKPWVPVPVVATG